MSEVPRLRENEPNIVTSFLELSGNLTCHPHPWIFLNVLSIVHDHDPAQLSCSKIFQTIHRCMHAHLDTQRGSGEGEGEGSKRPRFGRNECKSSTLTPTLCVSPRVTLGIHSLPEPLLRSFLTKDKFQDLMGIKNIVKLIAHGAIDFHSGDFRDTFLRPDVLAAS